MFLFPRGLRPVPVSCRAYSSYFSSKPGGGRYFNSAKPPKPVVTSVANKGKTDVSSSSADSGDGMSGPTNGNGNSNGSDHRIMKISDQTPASQNRATTNHSHDSLSSSSYPSTPVPTTPLNVYHQHSTFLHHPTVDSKDFKLHQFFSLHRPLLLLPHPTSIIFESLPPLHIHSLDPNATPRAAPAPTNLGTIDNPPEASPESDADAARQLARALVMSRVGGTFAWETTLRQLGLDVNLEEGRVGLKERCEKELRDIMMDSTKRKRRSKMKKHKLKKRRKATRAQRLKIGR